MEKFRIFTEFRGHLYSVTILAGILGIMLSMISAWKFNAVEDEAMRHVFHRDVDDKVSALEMEIKLNFEILYSIKGLFDNSDEVTPAEFQRMVQDILGRHDSIQALEWIPRVSGAERNFYEKKRKYDYPDFEITERSDRGTMIRAQERKQYFPVYYVEPVAGNESAFGFDLASDRTRQITLEESRDKGVISATPGIMLVQGKDNQKGFLAFIPVYNGNPKTVNNRREQLKGFILGVYKIDDIFNNAMKSTMAKDINIDLIDNNASIAGRLLYHYQANNEIVSDPGIVYEKKIPDVGGREWSVIATPTNKHASRRKNILPFVIFLFGTFFVCSLVSYSILILRKTEELNLANQALSLVSRTDGLTGAANRRYFDEYLQAEWTKAIREKHPLTIIMIDIDHFKQYNDLYGHLAGDECLKKVSKVLKENCRRPADLYARFGGEEFAIILPNTDNAFKLAEKCRSDIAKLKIPHATSENSKFVTISLGVDHEFPTINMKPNELIDKVDKALYIAKASGRNKVCTNPEYERQKIVA